MNQKEFQKAKANLSRSLYKKMDVELLKLNVIFVACAKLKKEIRITDATELKLFNSIFGMGKNIYDMVAYRKINKRVFKQNTSDETIFSCLTLLRAIFEGFIILKWILLVEGNAGLAVFRKNLYRLKGLHNSLQELESNSEYDTHIKTIAPNFYAAAIDTAKQAIKEISMGIISDPNFLALSPEQRKLIEAFEEPSKGIFPLRAVTKNKSEFNQIYESLSFYAHLSSHVLPEEYPKAINLKSKQWVLNKYLKSMNNLMATSLALFLDETSVTGLLNGQFRNIFREHIDKDVYRSYADQVKHQYI